MNRSTAIQPAIGQKPDAQAGIESSPEAQRVLRFEGVTKTYPHNVSRMLLRRGLLSWFKRSRTDVFYALRNVSFDLNAATSLAVVGANGAGKSTLLRCATGISAPEEGRIEVHGTIAALMKLGAGSIPI
jgi:ABC-type polysaccharide/polyol phosphate transport system ATPase subunit